MPIARTSIIGITTLLLAALSAAAPAGHLEGYVPAAAHGAGKFNSFWVTDLWIYRQGATKINLWYNPSGQDKGNAQSVVIPLTEPVTYLPDVLARTFGASGKGSIHYLADGKVEVFSRTWTTAPDGGTYGQGIPGIPASLAAVPNAGPDGALRLLVNQAEGFRANLGIVNVAPGPVTVSVDIFTADGQPAPGSPSFTVTLQPYDMQQLDDVLARVGTGNHSGMIIRVAPTLGNGAVLAYLSEVDNTTNAGAYQEAFRFGY